MQRGGSEEKETLKERSKRNSMNWNILVIEGKEIKRDSESNGEWNPNSQTWIPKVKTKEGESPVAKALII